MTPQQQQQRPEDDYSELNEEFSDLFGFHINPWSAAISFGQRSTRPQDSNRYTTRMRMPLSQAKALAVMMLRKIREYEGKAKVEIELPQLVLDELGIPAEDWRRFTFGEEEDS